ncbi:MAG: sugar transferase [Acutalibacteraceae bacterium]|nr:sugar transferase [Acutalibacteraceae bacterium]
MEYAVIDETSVKSNANAEFIASDNIENFIFEDKPLYNFFKRVFDIVCSLTLLICLSPIFLIIALLIVIDDHTGSPIFVQKRCGKNGTLFNLYKFRTMCPDAEKKLDKLQGQNEMDGPVFKIKNDPRITRLGKFLRATSIDEFPQLINILKGDMSFVGPRPALPKEVEQYNALHKVRLMVMPGLTCYWQIEPDRNSITFEEWMALDRKYISDRGMLLDIKIILKTFVAVFRREGC